MRISPLSFTSSYKYKIEKNNLKKIESRKKEYKEEKKDFKKDILEPSNFIFKSDLVQNNFPRTKYRAEGLEAQNFLRPFDPSDKTTTLPSRKKFLLMLECDNPLREGHFEDFLGDKKEIPLETFFVNLKHYKKDKLWALDMQNLTYFVSDLMINGASFDDILAASILGVNHINGGEFGYKRAQLGWISFPVNYTVCPNSRGEEYLRKYDCKMEKSFSPRPTDEFLKRANCVRIERSCGDFLVFYPELFFDDFPNLDLVKEIYNDLKSKENPTRKEIVDAMAKIQWLIAQETPFQRGSDSIATLLTRSIAHSYNIPTSPLKEGISLDFEAWGDDMEEYIEKYPNFFEINPLEELLSNS